MKSLKTNGVQEIEAFRRRVYRARAMDHISAADFSYLDQRCAEIEARIIEMEEKGTFNVITDFV